MSDNFNLSSRYGMRSDDFSALMKSRVREILLVASSYDAFVLEEDGQLTELIFEEYRNLDLNLRYAPRFARATTAKTALKFLKQRSFDLVVTSPRLPDMPVENLVAKIKKLQPKLAVGVLAAHAWDLPWIEEAHTSGKVDLVFLWQGDVRALMALIKQVEDRTNAPRDILEGGVQAIILVEDDVSFYSSYLPQMYTEVTLQTSRLMAEGLNLSHRLLRIRARPKILLAHNYEDAWDYYIRYKGNILGVISDIAYPRQGRLDNEAGLKLAARIRKRDKDVPILLQSLESNGTQRAAKLGASFVSKTSPTLLEDLRKYILDNFGFGDFIFKMQDGTEVARAQNMRHMLQVLSKVPSESIFNHASRNHFSSWLKARTEFELAATIRKKQASDFADADELKLFLTTTFTDYLHHLQQHVIADFDNDGFDEFTAFAKIGSGSLGGKGRGLAFMHKLLSKGRIGIEGVTIAIPQTVVLASDLFEQFIETNNLRWISRKSAKMTDTEVLDTFRRARFPHEVRADLAAFLEVVQDPIAVRSSSILEDSVYQPFAGVYATIMLPNSHPSLDIRLAQLLEAVKVVYASTFFQQSRDYLETTPYRIEEESMAVLVQRLVGHRNGDRFYPTFSGVASSYNFYPFRDMLPDDGVAQVAVGLGKSIVEGFEALRFCPKYPQVLPQFSSVQDILRNAQRRFYALDMANHDVIPGLDTDCNLVHLDTGEAIKEQRSSGIVSTYLRANDTITSGLTEGGAPLVTFSQLLKNLVLPLPTLLSSLLQECEKGMASPVEMEFAADLQTGLGAQQTFHIVQLRPMVIEKMDVDVEVEEDSMTNAVVGSNVALGHARREEVSDFLVIDPRRCTRAMTTEIAGFIEILNRKLRKEHRRYGLIGPGRWGSRDPWLGIPVTWTQISAARVIVEADFEDLQVEPSLGSHFFHNLTCFGVAFFAVHDLGKQGWVNWDWFAKKPALKEYMNGAIRLIRTPSPLEILVDGQSSRGVIQEAQEKE